MSFHSPPNALATNQAIEVMEWGSRGRHASVKYLHKQVAFLEHGAIGQGRITF